MNRDLAYRLQLRLDALKTEAIDAIRDILEKDNAHSVILNESVDIQYVNEHTYKETKEVYMTGQCFVVDSFGESEMEELKYIPILSLLNILELIEKGEYDIEDRIEE
jgi:hypothetical protein